MASDRRIMRARLAGDTFPALLERLHREQFTGATILHWGQGVPNAVEFVTTERLALVRVDKAAPDAHS